MSEMLQEYCHSGKVSMRVDRGKGVIHGVKILGLQSRNGRVYAESALRKGTQLYEGARVNVNHPKAGPLAPRDYQERLGVIRGVRFRSGEGLFGDLHYNPKHPVAEQLAWDAEHHPQNVGLSHNVLALTRREGDSTTVESITKVESVDLVADPATTSSLFENEKPLRASAHTAEGTLLAEVTLRTLHDLRPDLVRAVLAEAAEGEGRRASGEEQQLALELDRLRAERAALERRRHVRQVLVEHGLPDPDVTQGDERLLVSDLFVDQLLTAGDEASVRRLIEERVTLLKSVGEAARPRCRDQLSLGRSNHVHDAREFVASIT